MKRSLDDSRMKPGGPQGPDPAPWLKPRLDGGWAGYGVMILWLILFGYMLTGCAFGQRMVDLTVETVKKSAPFIAGYEIGKANPELAGEFIHYTDPGRANILVFYDSWKRYLAYRLGTDAVNRKLIENMLEAVEIEFVFKSPDKKIAIIRGLFMEFVEGLEAGIKHGRKSNLH